MKPNWRVVIALVLIVGVIGWAVSSVLPRSFSGSNLTFGVGGGTVTVTNPSDVPVAVQLVGNGTRTFTVSSSIDGVAGSSVKQGTGNTSTHLFEYALPPGMSDILVLRGSGVNFVSSSDTNLVATINPLSQNETRTTLIITAVIVLGGLFYISHTTGHRLIKTLLRREGSSPTIAVTLDTPPDNDDPNRGRDGRMYSNYGSKE
ncbi:MAG: hypothetical protein K8L97_30650 [Anaerolineae bacterium]|nr:hypothetical protein [Anaerolineae bacterium]